MTTLQNLRPITRAKMAQLSLPDIRAYAKAYKVPAEVIERGMVDELLDFIFKLRPCHPKNYPINRPHLFAHRIACVQEDRGEEPLTHNPYTGFAHRRIQSSFRKGKSTIGRPSQSEQGNRTEEATEEQCPAGGIEGESDENHSVPPEDPSVKVQSAVSFDMTPTTLTKASNQGSSPLLTIPSNNGLAPYQFAKSASPDTPTPGGGGANNERGNLPEMPRGELVEQIKIESQGDPSPPLPPLGFEGANCLSNLKSILEGRGEPQPEPSRFIIDDGLFDLEFTPDMTQAGKEAIICERYATAVSNRMMIEQMLAEAEGEVKQALWQLTVLQPQLYTARENIQGFVDEFCASTSHHGSHLMSQAISDRDSLARGAWGVDLNEEWIFTEEGRMREIAEARAAGVQVPFSFSPPVPRSPKRVRDEYGEEFEHADEGEARAGISEPDPKRPRVESRETSTVPSSPSPKRKDKGNTRTLVAEDSYTLPFPSSPAVPGCEPPKPSRANYRKQDGGHLSPSEIDDSNDGPELDPSQVEGKNGEDRGHDGAEGAEGRNQNATQMPPRGAPPLTRQQPKVPQRGDPWQVLRYDRSIWQGYIVTDHTQMPSESKRPVNWSVMGSQHPKGTNYREWDDGLEEQNPWHQGGRPILKR